jgi:hypothetical protein
MSDLSPKKFVPFDPARFRIEEHRMSTTQGSYSIYFDGQKVITYGDRILLHEDGQYLGAPMEEKMDAAKRLYERGHRYERIAPLWGGDPYLTADSSDVLQLETADGTPFFCQYGARGDEIRVYDQRHPQGDGDGLLIETISASVLLKEVCLSDVDWTKVVGKHDQSIQLGAVEWFAIQTFVTSIQKRALYETTRNAYCAFPSTLRTQKNDAERERLNLESIKEYLRFRGKDIQIDYASGYDTENNCRDLSFGNGGVTVRVSDSILPGDLIRWVDENDKDHFLEPIWKIETHEPMMVGGDMLRDLFIMPTTYRPFMPPSHGDFAREALFNSGSSGVKPVAAAMLA